MSGTLNNVLGALEDLSPALIEFRVVHIITMLLCMARKTIEHNIESVKLMPLILKLASRFLLPNGLRPLPHTHLCRLKLRHALVNPQSLFANFLVVLVQRLALLD